MARKNSKGSPKTTGIIKFVIVFVFLGFIFSFVFNRSRAFLKNAEFFRVKEIVQPPNLSVGESGYLENQKGKSIFEVDLNGIQRYLQNKYPDMAHLRVVRIFPNRISIQAQMREPYALIEGPGQNVLVDEVGVILASGTSSSDDLPKIRGINSKALLQKGSLYHGRELSTALTIIKTIKQNKYLDPYRIGSIDINRLSKIDLYLNFGALRSQLLYVILDQDKISQKIQQLGILLSQGQVDPQVIKYIDLRFKEPILSKQPEKAN